MALTQIVNDGLGASLTATSEGGAVTTSIQQGIAKAWLTCVGDNTAIDDSLNISSLTDVTSATGRQNYSSSFNNVHYSFVGQAESTFSTTMVNLFYTHADKTASATQYFTVTSAGAPALVTVKY